MLFNSTFDDAVPAGRLIACRSGNPAASLADIGFDNERKAPLPLVSKHGDPALSLLQGLAIQEKSLRHVFGGGLPQALQDAIFRLANKPSSRHTRVGNRR